VINNVRNVNLIHKIVHPVDLYNQHPKSANYVNINKAIIQIILLTLAIINVVTL